MTDTTTRLSGEQMVLDLTLTLATVAPEKVYRHRNGGHYLTRGVAYREEDMTVCVRYSPLHERNIEFFRPMKEFQERFKRIEDPRR